MFLKTKAFKSCIFPKTQKNMRNIKNMTLFCQIQGKTIISSQIYTNNYRKYIYIAKTLFVKNQLKSSKNQKTRGRKNVQKRELKNVKVLKMQKLTRSILTLSENLFILHNVR